MVSLWSLDNKVGKQSTDCFTAMMVTESVSVNIYFPLTDVIRHHLPSLSSSEVFNYLVTHIFLFVKKKKEKTKKKQTSPPSFFFPTYLVTKNFTVLCHKGNWSPTKGHRSSAYHVWLNIGRGTRRSCNTNTIRI